MADRKSVAPGSTVPEPSRATLPADRAFVVQLRADVDLGRGLVSGRVEHVISGVTTLFESVEELIRCMRGAVERRSGEPRGARVAPKSTDGEVK
jgi:hypothetical protein